MPSCVSLADKLVIFPQPSEGAAPPAERHLVREGDSSIELWQVPHPEPRAYAIRFYGNADLADRWITNEGKTYADLGIELWAVNYPGFGMSSGPASLAGVARAAGIAFDHVKSLAGGKPIVLIGTSLGTTAALHVSATRPAAGVILVNPPALRELIVGEFGWWNLWILAKQVAGQIPDALDSVSNARASKCPALFVSATRDEVVRAKYQQLVFEAYAGAKSLVTRPEAFHNTPIDLGVRERIHEALRKMIGG
jgi:pimeloyl-ACP methyl ester carboxylesterase